MIKYFLVLCALLSNVALASNLSKRSFFPESIQTYVEEGVLETIQAPVFNKIIDAGLVAYKKEAEDREEVLRINKLWTDGTVNANVSRSKKYGGVVTINMYGGLARHPLINESGFAIVLCHELGHAYGGAPFVYIPTELSAEGQADYVATEACYRRVFALVPELQVEEESYEPFIEEQCGEDLACKNGLVGSKGLAELLAELMGKKEKVSFETPDPYVTPRTMLSYPRTAQCRLDSYFLGMMKMPRPPCWFKD
jgi:hypothetical protein